MYIFIRNTESHLPGLFRTIYVYFPWLPKTVLSSGHWTKSDFHIHLLSAAIGSSSGFRQSPATTADFGVHWLKMRQRFGWFFRLWFHDFPGLGSLNFKFHDFRGSACTPAVAVQCRILKSQYRDHSMLSIKLLWLVVSHLVQLSPSPDLGLVRWIFKPHYIRNAGGITDHQILGHFPEIHDQYSFVKQVKYSLWLLSKESTTTTTTNTAAAVAPLLILLLVLLLLHHHHHYCDNNNHCKNVPVIFAAS